MNARELFRNILHYRGFDRMPVMHWGGWRETRARWIEEGLDANVPEHVAFGAAPFVWSAGPNVSLMPAFEQIVYEETQTWRIVRDGDGSITKWWINKAGVPEHIGYTLNFKGENWDAYQQRLQPHPNRLKLSYYQPGSGFRTQPIRPEAYELPATVDQLRQMSFAVDAPVCVNTGSIFGWIRNWIGVEELAYAAYDNPGLLEEMIGTITDLVVWGLEQILPEAKVDLAWGWEDICFKNGPLISPAIMETFGVPAYRRIADTLNAHGVDLYLVDTDGFIEDLVPYWLDAGVNLMFPLEIGAWQEDPMRLRRKFGRQMLVYGGMDKSQFALGPDAIDAEIERRRPLMAEGGFVPLSDHLIPPNVSLDHYKYYLAKLAELRF